MACLCCYRAGDPCRRPGTCPSPRAAHGNPLPRPQVSGANSAPHPARHQRQRPSLAVCLRQVTGPSEPEPSLKTSQGTEGLHNLGVDVASLLPTCSLGPQASDFSFPVNASLSCHLERAFPLLSVRSNPLSPLWLCLALGDFSELHPQLDSPHPVPATLYTFLCPVGQNCLRRQGPCQDHPHCLARKCVLSALNSGLPHGLGPVVGPRSPGEGSHRQALTLRPA